MPKSTARVKRMLCLCIHCMAFERIAEGHLVASSPCLWAIDLLALTFTSSNKLTPLSWIKGANFLDCFDHRCAHSRCGSACVDRSAEQCCLLALMLLQSPNRCHAAPAAAKSELS